MRLSAFARMHVVQKEEKESRLKEFIERDLSSVAERTADTPRPTYRLIALSPESPAALALASFAQRAAELGIEIEAVFLRKPQPSRGTASSPTLPAASCRYVSDQRFLDAHEQLVLGARTVWIGDCMRREPSKRDAFECYSNDCEATARRAERSFERIRSAAAAGTSSRAPRQQSYSTESLFEAALLASTDAEPKPLSLRH